MLYLHTSVRKKNTGITSTDMAQSTRRAFETEMHITFETGINRLLLEHRYECVPMNTIDNPESCRNTLDTELLFFFPRLAAKINKIKKIE